MPDSDRHVEAPGQDVPTPPPVSPGASRAAVRALWLVVAIAIAAGGYAWYQLNRDGVMLRNEVAQRLTAVDASSAQARVRESDLANELREAQAKLALLEARLGEFQSQQASLEALYRELAPSRDELALSEVEQILVLAS